MPRLLHIDRNDLQPQILYIKPSFGYSNLNLVYFLSKIPHTPLRTDMTDRQAEAQTMTPLSITNGLRRWASGAGKPVPYSSDACTLRPYRSPEARKNQLTNNLYLPLFDLQRMQLTSFAYSLISHNRQCHNRAHLSAELLKTSPNKTKLCAKENSGIHIEYPSFFCLNRPPRDVHGGCGGYFVALMLTTALNTEFALVFAEQIALTL